MLGSLTDDTHRKFSMKISIKSFSTITIKNRHKNKRKKKKKQKWKAAIHEGGCSSKYTSKNPHTRSNFQRHHHLFQTGSSPWLISSVQQCTENKKWKNGYQQLQLTTTIACVEALIQMSETKGEQKEKRNCCVQEQALLHSKLNLYDEWSLYYGWLTNIWFSNQHAIKIALFTQSENNQLLMCAPLCVFLLWHC